MNIISLCLSVLDTYYAESNAIAKCGQNNPHFTSIHSSRGIATGRVGGVTPPKFFKKRKIHKKTENCHKWQQLWLLAYPIKFEQFYKKEHFGILLISVK